jgi:hypothetical protein
MLCELVTWSDILLKRKEMVPGYTLRHITKGFRLDNAIGDILSHVSKKRLDIVKKLLIQCTEVLFQDVNMKRFCRLRHS